MVMAAWKRRRGPLFTQIAERQLATQSRTFRAGKRTSKSGPAGNAPIADIGNVPHVESMKSYAVVPTFDLHATDPRTRDYIDLASEFVAELLTRDGDYFQFVVDWRDPGQPIGGSFSADSAEPHVTRLADANALINRLKACIDPNGRLGMTIRSIATCRAATFGFDGQAFLCLRHEDDAPVSPEPSLIRVSGDYDFLTQTDYFDGWVRPNGNGS